MSNYLNQNKWHSLSLIFSHSLWRKNASLFPTLANEFARPFTAISALNDTGGINLEVPLLFQTTQVELGCAFVAAVATRKYS